MGYAYEGLARVDRLANNRPRLVSYLDEARHIADTAQDEEAKQWLLDDLSTIA